MFVPARSCDNGVHALLCCRLLSRRKVLFCYIVLAWCGGPWCCMHWGRGPCTATAQGSKRGDPPSTTTTQLPFQKTALSLLSRLILQQPVSGLFNWRLYVYMSLSLWPTFLTNVLNKTPIEVLEQLHEAQVGMFSDSLVLCKPCVADSKLLCDQGVRRGGPGSTAGGRAPARGWCSEGSHQKCKCLPL